MNGDLRAAFTALDWGILGSVFCLSLVVIGFWPRRETTEDYLIADRGLSLPVFTATLVATWYGGILGVGEFVYSSGLVNWTTNGLPYYVFALLFAVFLARRVRGGAAHMSIRSPTSWQRRMTPKRHCLGAVFAFVYAAPSAYILMTGTLLHILFGWPLLPAILAGRNGVFSGVCLSRRLSRGCPGQHAAIPVLMFAGFITVAAVCLTKFGGLAYSHRAGTPAAGPLEADGDLRPGICPVVWFFIALVTLTDPGFHQRCYAAQTPRVAALGIGARRALLDAL